MNEQGYKLIVDGARAAGAKFPTQSAWLAFKAAIDAAVNDNAAAPQAAPTAEPSKRRIGPRGIALMHSFETCKLVAYPDPGSRDGRPWTIGWGSTGDGIGPGAIWTQAQCNERFAHDVNDVYGAAVDRLLGNAPTTQSQFDAMVCLCYNIGIGSTNPAKPGGFTRSSVLRLHKAGDYQGAARAFLMWNKNDGKVMRGLTRRRLAESDLYDDDGVPQ